MDGVVVDSEPYWTAFEEPFFREVFGEKVAKEVGHAPGRGIVRVYEEAIAKGAIVDEEKYHRGFDNVARRVYKAAPLTQGIGSLVDGLLELKFKIAIVTQSSESWIVNVLPKLPFREKLDAVVSIGNRSDLRPKPAPDGFLEAFRLLNADPKRSMILEDSNLGLQAAKASGAFTIAYRGNLSDGYKQEGADAYADTMEEVQKLVEEFTRR